jgi:amino acid adenylation domain-containing protein
MDKKNIEAIYPLSPMQHGMLFETLYSKDKNYYIEQLSFSINDNQFEHEKFMTAWEYVATKHSVLRSLFVWEKAKKPLQIVLKQLELKPQVLDWTTLPEKEQASQLKQYLQQDRETEFELATAPLMRFCFIRLAENKWHFIWTHHHLLLDGWSLGIILKDVFTFYLALMKQEAVLVQPSKYYANYIQWLSKQDVNQAKQFWQENLKNVEPSAYFGYSPKTSHYSQKQFSLSAQLKADIQQFTQQQQLTFFTIMQGAWAFLLSHYANQNDVIFGTTVSGRIAEIENVESIAGLLINTLPVRVKIEAQPLVTWLKNLQAQHTQREQYAHIPLADIQTLADVKSGQKLFDSLLVVENYPLDDAVKQNLKFINIQDIEIAEKVPYPLLITFLPHLDLQIRFTYDSNQFDDATIHWLFEHFQFILQQFVSSPQQLLQQFSLLTPQDKKQIEQQNQTEKTYPQYCIHQLFEQQVEKTPDNIAVVFKSESLTYRQLNEKSNHLAHYLPHLSVKPETLVALCLERSLDVVISILAILKAGGAYVPLELAYPDERLNFIINDAQAPVLLTSSHLKDKFLSLNSTNIVCIDDLNDRLTSQSQQNLQINITAENLCYVIYTSGSTGLPKGCLIQHNNVTRLFTQTQAWYQFNQNDVWTLFHSYAFDFSVWELWGALIYGGKLIVVPYWVSRSTADFYTLLQQQQVTVLNQTPSAFYQLSQIDNQHDDKLNLRYVIFGGEALDITALQAWFDKNGDKAPQLVNMYGITETTVHVTYRPINQQDLASSASVIGQPIPDLNLYILDKQQNFSPINIIGEMYVGGLGVARGYLNREELTQKRFIQSPFNPTDKLYRTGDLARYLPNGDIEYLGRIDHQVKIRGFRIELGEIEALINQFPTVQTSFVSIYETQDDKKLAAYFVANDNIQQTDLKAYLKDKLPDYMLPSYFMQLEVFPLTPNGKIDRNALPEPEKQTDSNQYVAPRNELEQTLADIWQTILDVPKVSIYDDFFDLGGHSLLSVRLVAQVREKFNIDLSVADIFKYPTFIEFSQLILSNTEAINNQIPVVSRQKPLLASFSQQNLWLMSKLDNTGTMYNIPISLRILGKLDIAALKNSFNVLLQRHEILRTVFDMQQDTLMQIVKPYQYTDIKVINLQDVPKSQRLQATKTHIWQQAQQVKDLTQDALFELFVLQLNETEFVLLILVHHILNDGWSTAILGDELTALYEHFAYEQSLDLPELAIQYADAAAWQHEQLQAEKLQKQLDYWKKQLKDIPNNLQLPTDYPQRLGSQPGAVEKIVLEKPLIEKIAHLRHNHNTSTFIILLTALKILLYKWTQQEDLVIGTVVAGRNHSQFDNLLGCFINLLAIRSHPNSDISALQFFKQVHQNVFEAYDYQDCPFIKVVEALNQEHETPHNSIYNVGLLLQNFAKPAFSPKGLEVSILDLQQQPAYLDLRFVAYETDEQILFECEYNTHLFKSTTIQHLLQDYSHFLALLVETPDLPLAQFNLSLNLLQQAHLPHLLHESEQKQIDTWNNTSKTYPHACLHQLVERQVQATPDAIAAIYENQQLTYQQLNKKANQLAHYLRSLGVQTEDFVGIYIERSLEMIIGLLGILKAGAAYVPLDPSYPTERIEFMLQDAAPPVLLTQQHLLSSLPEYQEQILCLDSDWYKIAKKSTKNINLPIELNQLAYMIYTSGSTGKPKGAMNPHLAISNRLLWMQDAYQLTENDTILQKTPFSFDVSVWELFWSLLTGAKMLFAKPEGHKDAAYLITLIEQYQVTTLHFVPSMLQLFLQTVKPDECHCLRQVFCSGEALPVDLQNKFFTTFPHVALHNLYGPTEAAVDVTYWQCQADEKRHTVPIGKPINNIKIHILDNDLHPVPIGIAGELHIAGIGVARGYHNRPELSAEKFIDNPLSQAETLIIPQPTADLSLTRKILSFVNHKSVQSPTLVQVTPANKLYKTGDLARWLPEGEIEYLGRIDHQVKIRGFRIELGEIEAVITQHSQVNECVVLVQEGEEIEDKQLIAFVVPEITQDAHQESAYVEQVSEIYHHTYGDVDEQATDFNIAGWNSSYTGKAIPDVEMQEWVKFTVQRILDLKPQHIVEIGCGTGLLLSRIAPHCLAYLGLDLSAEAIAHVSQLQKSHAELNNVKLQQAPADDFTAITPDTYDTLVINSVVQHFPSVEYFANVLAQAIDTVKQNGRIFIGDIRSFSLLQTYHASVQLYQAHCEINLAELGKRIEKQLAQEEELVIAPDFFSALQAQHPRIQHIEIYPKRGEFFNELTKFRFDVVLHIGQAPKQCDVTWLDWQSQWDLTAIRAHLSEKQPKTFALCNIDNLRLAEENALLQQLQQDKTQQTIAEFRDTLDKTQGLNPEALYQLADELDYQIEISWLHTNKQGQFSVVFKQADIEGLANFAKPHVESNYQLYANTPLQQSGIYQQNLIADLKQSLQKQLPDYMNPAHYVLLDNIPLTPNGKADRQALLTMDIHANRHSGDLRPARDAIEKALVEIWQEILNIKPIGVKDNFFELGGHSLLAIRVMSKIEQQFGQNLPLATLFEGATIERLADIVRNRVEVLNWQPVVKIQPHGHKPILYCVPGAGGNVVYYYGLAHALGNERPFYGLQSKGLDGVSQPFATIEEIASHHIAHVKQIQPEGEYYLSGHSFGAYVAFEMARQLEQQGDKVALLALLDLDATFHGHTSHPCRNWDEITWILEYSQAAKLMTGKDIMVKKADLVKLDTTERYRYFKQKLEQVDILPPNTSMQQFTAYIHVFKNNTLAMMRYCEPSVQLEAKIALFKTKMGIQIDENAAILQQTAWGWQKFAKQEVSVYDVPGDHISMISSPHVNVLAEKINFALKVESNSN